MSYVIGIDTGGTYTDAVLLNRDRGEVLKTAKALTTPSDLALGIVDCLKELLESEKPLIDKVILSTTLATNAIVEDMGQKVGLICIGEKPNGELPAKEVHLVEGLVNVKGRELVSINESEILHVLTRMLKDVDAIAISGYMSVRNPSQEIKVRDIVNSACELPVICAHELAHDLGFYERTVTTVLNARLLPLISNFLISIKKAVSELAINANIFILRGDGSVVEAEAVRKRPVETMLSGPAASINAAQYLTEIKDAIVVDMGGTTTDTSCLAKGNTWISERGAKIGRWQTMVRSLDIHTFGLGGDSRIQVISADDIRVGPQRTLPACRGGTEMTPTDILHYHDEFNYGNKQASLLKIKEAAGSVRVAPNDFISIIENKIIDLIHYECIAEWKREGIPVIGLGAPVAAWLKKWSEKYHFDLIIPKHYAVANAIGAAVATVEETETAIIRPGEGGYGYLVHTRFCRASFKKKEEALEFAIETLKKEVYVRANKHGARHMDLSVEYKDIFTGNEIKNYVETIVKVVAVENLQGK